VLPVTKLKRIGLPLNNYNTKKKKIEVMKIATIILNRNLPLTTDKLYENIAKNNSDITDIYVVESGSDEDRRSQYCTWWANDEDSIKNGLRYGRGFNFGLTNLINEKKYESYDYFFLVCNDVELEEKPILHTLLDEIEKHPQLGILSPCSPTWAEGQIIGPDNIRYFWHVHFNSWLIRRSYMDDVRELEDPNRNNFFFDGSNFRGYYSDIEMVAKGYANDWATGITTKVIQNENDSYLKTKSDLMKTDPYEKNLIKVFDEGKNWLRGKYGFNSRWTMQAYAKFFYERFFEFHPEFNNYKIS